MKTKIYQFHGTNLTKEQFIGLSWLAYYKRLNDGSEQYKRGVLLASHTFCETVLNIEPVLLYQVEIENNCKDLQNMNRLQSIELWSY